MLAVVLGVIYSGIVIVFLKISGNPLMKDWYTLLCMLTIAFIAGWMTRGGFHDHRLS